MIVQSEVNERLLERLGVHWMIRLGLRVTIFDVADVIFPYIARDRSGYSSISSVDIIIIGTANECDRLASGLIKADAIFCYAGNGIATRRSLPILRAVSRSGKPYLIARTESLPAQDIAPQKKSYLQKIEQLLGRENWFDRFLARIPTWCLGLRSADVHMVGGLQSIVRLPLDGTNTRLALAHCFDYEMIRELPDRPADNIAVFVDQNLPFHRDWQQVAKTQVVDPENYYAGLRRLFDRIEKETGLSVVIAVHPSADYSDGARFFGDRSLVKGSTTDLLARCRLAITSTSLAIGTAVAKGRAVLIVTTHDFYASRPGWRFLQPLAQAVGSPLLFLEDDTPLDFEKLIEPDLSLYDRFVADYLRHPDARDESMWQIALTALSGERT